MFKVVYMGKKRDDISMEEFITKYESDHAKVGQRVLVGAKRYVRKFLTEISNPLEPNLPAEYDVLTEIWFDDRASFERCMLQISGVGTMTMIKQDGSSIFDQSKGRLMRSRNTKARFERQHRSIEEFK